MEGNPIAFGIVAALREMGAEELTKGEVQAIITSAVLAGPLKDALEKESLWKIEQVASAPHWLHLSDAKFARDEVWPKLQMDLKWDGCMHLEEYMPKDENHPERTNYWHICGVSQLDELIARLQEARRKGVTYFGKTHPEEWH